MTFKVKNRVHRRIPEAERETADAVRKNREDLVRRIRHYHYDRKPGQTRMPYIWETVYRFRGETSVADIRAILSHRVDGDVFGEPKPETEE